MPSSVSEKVSTINEKIKNANKSSNKEAENFSNIASYIIFLSSIYVLPYYYYFFRENLFT